MGAICDAPIYIAPPSLPRCDGAKVTTPRSHAPAGRQRFLVCPMRVEDIPGVVGLAGDEPTAPHWPLAEYHRMLDVILEAPARRGAWVVVLEGRPPTPAAEPAVVFQELREAGSASGDEPLPRHAATIAGFAMASHVAGVCDLEALVVDAAWRGRRLGRALVEAAAGWGRRLSAARLQLEVRASNGAALRLYQRMGFRQDGRRPGYYRNPEEEAVLMSLLLGRFKAGESA